MSGILFGWDRGGVAEDVAEMLELLSEDHPFVEGDGDVHLRFVKDVEKGVNRVERNGAEVTVHYGDLTGAARGAGSALSGLTGEEKMTFTTYGIMLDVSRNGVMTVEHFKKWLRMLALMGYNMAMLYTEDVYRLENEPYFGYMRGAYTLAEIQELDAYASKLGVEMIGCIQTLGHMEQVIKWDGAYTAATDTARVLNVGEEATYSLIEKIIDFWSRALRSRRIHIGMDETHDLGRGRYMDKFGYTNGFELFNRHLGRVNAICRAKGLRPMIWSDMYFRLGNETQNYYDLKTNIPREVRDNIPENVELVYWDYYHNDYSFYRDFIKLHQELNRPVALGSGVWTWSKFWYDHFMTKATVTPGIQACRDTGVKEVFFTLWGDDGAYCAFDSAMAGLAFAAEVTYGNGEAEERIAKRFEAVCGGDYQAYLLAGDLDIHGDKFPDFDAIPGYRLFWDDPVMGLGWNCHRLMNPDFDDVVLRVYGRIVDGLARFRNTELDHPRLIAETVIAKVRFRRKMLALYASGDRAGLGELAAEIQGIVKLYEECSESFRKVWLSTFRPFGFEIIQIRNAGQIARWHELERRLAEYSTGELATIAELDENLTGAKASLANWVKGVQTSSSIM